MTPVFIYFLNKLEKETKSLIWNFCQFLVKLSGIPEQQHTTFSQIVCHWHQCACPLNRYTTNTSVFRTASMFTENVYCDVTNFAPFQLLCHVCMDKHYLLCWYECGADMTVYQPGNFLYNVLKKNSKYVIRTIIECAMRFWIFMQLWNTNTPVFVSSDADLKGITCIFQWSLEREFMYFDGKLMFLIVLASVQIAVNLVATSELRFLLKTLVFEVSKGIVTVTSCSLWGPHLLCQF